MADSLNTGIQKLGDTLSAKLLGASKENPEGSSNFSGVYFGPGGGVTRTDSFTIDGNRYGAAFLPVGYFDQTNQWISGIMSDIIKSLPGVTKTNSDNVEQKFPQSVTDSRTGFEIQYSGEGGIYSHVGNGFIPPGFFDPNTKLWYDSRLSLLIPEFPPGIHRTEGVGVFGPQPLEDLDNPDNAITKPGFTPVAYFRTGKEIYLGQKNIENNVGVVTSDEAKDYSKKYGRDGFFDSALSGDYTFKYGLEDVVKWYSDGLTPNDNEDPLFVGFEIVIDQPNSPLFNGEAAKFIEKFYSNSEIGSRGTLLNETIGLMLKFFRLNGAPRLFSRGEVGFLSLSPNTKRHYIKKITGLNKLVEANTPSSQASFTKYKQDLITLGFYEDTTLNLGTLASLYKSLYWSRINGKNVIPENLLRFDCQIIVSEVRNLSRIVRVTKDGGDILQTLKENVSRYVYDVYECQLFFDKMTHGDSIDIGSNQPSAVENYDLSFSYKFSTMRFERFNFERSSYATIDNKNLKPQVPNSKDANSAFITDGGIQPTNQFKFRPLRNGYSGKDIEDDLNEVPSWSVVSDSRPYGRGSLLSEDLGEPNLDSLARAEKYRIYANAYDKATPELGNQNMNFLNISEMMGSPNGLKGASENKISGKIGDVLKDAGKNLLQNVKKAALNEAQRQLNNQFRLVNNSLDKIRNSFGIGRIPPPTNVYDSPPGGQFFFDVQNSLRNFGGDILGGILGG